MLKNTKKSYFYLKLKCFFFVFLFAKSGSPILNVPLLLPLFPGNKLPPATQVDFPGGSWLFASLVLKRTWLRQLRVIGGVIVTCPAVAGTEVRKLMVFLLWTESGLCLLPCLKFLRHKVGAVVSFRYWRRKKLNAYPIFSWIYFPSHRLVACELGARRDNIILFARDWLENPDLSLLARGMSLATAAVSGLGTWPNLGQGEERKVC